MRVQVYREELDLNTDPEIVTKVGKGESGEEVFYGIRFYLHSADALHDSEKDDDRSAVTFWIPTGANDRLMMAHLFNAAYERVLNAIMPDE